MEVVGPGLQDGDDRAPVGVSVAGVGVGRDHAQFLDGIWCRVVADKIVLWFVVVGPLDHVVVGLLPITVDRHDPIVVHVALDGVVAGQPGRVRVDGTRLKQCKRGKVSPVQWDVLDFVRR